MATRGALCGISVLMTAVACEGFGRPIVGEVIVTQEADCRSVLIPACRYARPESVPLAAAEFDPFAVAGCARPSQPTVLDGSHGAPLPAQLECAAVEVQLSGGTDLPRWPALRARATELRLVAEEPVTVTLAAADFESVEVVLEGPVALQIVDGSSLNAVRFSSETALATIQLRDARASLLTVEIVGAVNVERSKLVDVLFVAAQSSFDTSSFERLSVATTELFAAQLNGEQLALEVGRARISASTIDRLTLERCGSMVILSSAVQGGRFSPCNEHPLRVDGSVVSQSEMLGSIESISSEWFGNSFGAGVPTFFELWRSLNVVGNVLCRDTRRFALVETHSAACNSCEALGASGDTAVCGVDAVPRPTEPTLGNAEYGTFNPLCLPLDTPPLCEPPPVDRTPR